MMAEAEFFDVLRQALMAAVVMSTPILAAALIVGLLIGLFQALTSVQEMTLTFVPKVAAMLGVFWVSMTFMTQTLTSFWADSVIPLVAGS
ncbi:MAG: flagellar biosynthetic protein FliQ [Pseudomonadota bacterium]